MRTFDELLDAHLFGLRGPNRAQALKSFMAGAMAVSYITRNQLADIESAEPPSRRYYRKREQPKTQQIQPKATTPYFFTGRNATV